MNPVTTSKTTKRIPPPGPSLRTLGVKPLYNAENLSKRLNVEAVIL